MQFDKLSELCAVSEQHIKNLIADKKIRIMLISTLIWGILAHGMILFNKYSVYDDINNLFGVGATYTSGRWMLAVLQKITKKLFGQGVVYSLPLINGLISILLIGLSSCFIIDLLKIKKPVICVGISGILVTFPVITGIFGDTFTAPYYMFSVLLTVIGVWLLSKKKCAITFIVSVLIMASAIGIYQAFIPLMLSLSLIYYLFYLTDYIRGGTILYGMTCSLCFT